MTQLPSGMTQMLNVHTIFGAATKSENVRPLRAGGAGRLHARFSMSSESSAAQQTAWRIIPHNHITRSAADCANSSRTASETSSDVR